MNWIISANGNIYDHASSFATNGFIDWRQRVRYSAGDTVYIYCTRPWMRIMYKCEVVRHSIPFSECIDDSMFWIDPNEYEKSKSGEYARLKLLEQVDTPYLSLTALKSHGLKAAPQGPVKVSEELNAYIEQYFNDCYAEGYFVDVDERSQYHEGHVRSVKVNIYERSSIARGKCIAYHGSACVICGLNFGERYGDLGEGFIHVHHLKPLHSIRQDYVVDYKNDLVPVCPNCHAMIHRIPQGEEMDVDALRAILGVRAVQQEEIQRTENREERLLPTNPVLVTDVENPPPVTAGALVKHKTYGDGTIKSIDFAKKHMVVSFAGFEKVFVFPDAVEQGFLVLK